MTRAPAKVRTCGMDYAPPAAAACAKAAMRPRVSNPNRKLEVRDQAQDLFCRNIDRLANRLAVFAPTNGSSLRRRDSERCGARLCRRVIEHKVELTWWKLLSVVHIEQIKIHHHDFAVTDLAESLKHQIHPNRLDRAIHLLSHITCLPAEFQRAQVFEWNESHCDVSTIL